jgi:hypothetical protein
MGREADHCGLLELADEEMINCKGMIAESNRKKPLGTKYPKLRLSFEAAGVALEAAPWHHSITLSS